MYPAGYPRSSFVLTKKHTHYIIAETPCQKSPLEQKKENKPFRFGPQPPGYLAAQTATRLSLLPSGPDEVHGTILRKTWTL